jgi:hypothetical protein
MLYGWAEGYEHCTEKTTTSAIATQRQLLDPPIDNPHLLYTPIDNVLPYVPRSTLHCLGTTPCTTH